MTPEVDESTDALLRLAQAALARASQTGVGTPGALPELNTAIDLCEKADAALQSDATARGPVCALLGFMLATRVVAYNGTDDDRETAIRTLEEALTFPELTQTMRAVSRMSLGQLYLARATQVLSRVHPVHLIGGSGLQDAAIDADRAAESFRRVLAEEHADPAIATNAGMLLELAEVLRSMLTRPGGGSWDIGRLAGAMATLQRLQSSSGGLATRPLNFANMNAVDVAPSDPLHGPNTARVQAEPPPSEAARQALRARMAAAGGVLALLGPAAPPVLDVDDIVALAATAAHGTDSGPMDQVLLAVALYLRGNADDGMSDDWGDSDHKQAAELLHAAAPGTSADADQIMLLLADRLGLALG